MKKKLMFILLAVTLLPMAALADTTNGIKDREYYRSFDTQNGFGTTIQLVADWGTYRVYIASTQGVHYTVLAMFDKADAEGYWGYVAAGKYEESDDIADNYLHATFATQGYFERDPKNGFLEIYYTDGDTRIKELFIPSYIELDAQHYYKDNNSENYEALKGKKFKVVGVDFGAFAGIEPPRIVLPSSATYIGTCAFRNSGPGEDNAEGGIDFWDGVNHDSNRSYDGNTEEWKALNNIEAIAQQSFRESSFQYFDKMFHPGKLQTLGPLTSNDDSDNHCFYSGNLKALDLTLFTKITEIPTGAFEYNYSQLGTVTLGGDITKIHARAFKECRVLETATLNCPGLTLLGEEAFANCASGTFGKPTAGLTSVDLTGCKILEELSEKAFSNCYRLSTLKLSKSITTIGAQCFQYNGFTGRFDIPDHITSIGDEAFYRCRISYLPISDRTEPLSVGTQAFFPANDLTVDLSSTTKVPDITAPGGRPFDVYTTSRTSYKIRIIVPIGKAEEYVANKTGIGYLYKHHEYRVKFSSPTYAERAKWTNPDTGEVETADWWVGSSSWDNDIYTFKPYHGGTVDNWTSEESTNQAGETKDLYTAKIDYYYKNAGTTNNPKMGTFVAGESSTASIAPRTAHKYYNNYGTAEKGNIDIPRIGTLEVADGVVPPGVGILLTFTKKGTFLVPPFDDWVEETKLTSVGVIRNQVKINSIGTVDANRLLASSDGATTHYDDATLNGIKGGTWIDIEEKLAKVRVMRVYDDDGTTSTVKAVDLMGTFDFGSLTEVKHWTTASASQTIPFVHGQEIDLDATCTNGQKKYVFDTSKDKAEADYLYMEYTVASDFDFFSAYADPEDYIATKLTATGEGLGGRTGYQKKWSSTPRYWYNLFSLVGKETKTGNFVKANSNYAENHKDNGNILVPRIERKVVWPFYMDVDETTYTNHEATKNGFDVKDIGYYHEQNDDGTWKEPEMKYLIGGTETERQALNEDDNKSGFISFGMSNGYFVGTNNPGLMGPNKAFMRVHLSELHPELHNPNVQAGGSGARMAIVDISVYKDSATGITTIDNNARTTVADDAWYTLDGRKLSTSTTHSSSLPKGIYVHGGKKVVVK